MSEFESALEIVHSVLISLRDNGNTRLSASTATLDQLRNIRPASTGLAPRAQEHPRAAIAAAPPSRGPAGGVKADRMAALRARALICEKCPHLVRSRTQVVFGVGNIDADLMFVG